MRTWASVKAVKNLGNFESLHIEQGLEVDGKPGETPDELMERVYRKVYEFVESKVAEEGE